MGAYAAVYQAAYPGTYGAGAELAGDRLITFQIVSGGQPVVGARITVLSGSTIVAVGTSDSSGESNLLLLDGDYTVRVATTPIYNTLDVQDLTVSADASVVYSLTQAIVNQPDYPAMCAVRFFVRQNSSPVVDAIATAEPVDLNVTTDDVLFDGCILRGRTNSSGYVDLVLIQSAEFTRGGKYHIRVQNVSGKIVHDRTVTVPSVSNAYAEDLPDA
jgi:hypothetical protein